MEEHESSKDEALETLEVQLTTALQVNRHLAQQVEQLALEVDDLKQQLKRATAAVASKPLLDPIKSIDPPELVNQTKDWDKLRTLAASQGWLIDSREVHLGGILGEGAFGTTYKGTWRGAEVAVKAVRIANGVADPFAREASALSLIHHPHVLRLFGAVIEPPEKCWLICEFLPGGSLSTWLYGHQQGMWPPKRTLAQKLQIALDIASGMASLQSHDPPILHRDLKPANIMIDGAGRARVCDMGLSRVLTQEALVSLTPETGSYLYMAPEVVRHDLYLSPADVFSFGVLLVEILTQSRPYGDRHLTPVQLALAVSEGTITPTVPSACPSQLAPALRAALSHDPMARPSFDSLCLALRQSMQQVEGAAGSGGAVGVSAAAAQVQGAAQKQLAAFGKWLLKPQQQAQQQQ